MLTTRVSAFILIAVILSTGQSQAASTIPHAILIATDPSKCSCMTES